MHYIDEVGMMPRLCIAILVLLTQAGLEKDAAFAAAIASDEEQWVD